jgi:hypothetical protein
MYWQLRSLPVSDSLQVFVLLQFTDSDYRFGIFKLFLQHLMMLESHEEM